jgi:hypothetical protein
MLTDFAMEQQIPGLCCLKAKAGCLWNALHTDLKSHASL